MPAIITLTTDWGLKDFYVSAVKGAIFSQCPDANIVDISHDVTPFDIIQASFILKHTYRNFPAGTIHIIGVNSQPEKDNSYLVVKSNGHYFIGADNGIFSIIFGKEFEKLIAITPGEIQALSTFPVKDIFVNAACHVALGKDMAELGEEKFEFWEKILLFPAVDSGMIRGTAIYIDSYENIITNITFDLFKEIGRDRPFTIFLRKFQYNINHLSTSYSDVVSGEKLALFNSLNLLEIAMNKGNASSLLGIKVNDPIRIEFHDSPDS